MASPLNRGSDKRIMDFLYNNPGSNITTMREHLCYRGPSLAPAAITMGLSSLRHKGFIRTTAVGYFLTTEGERKKAELDIRFKERNDCFTGR